MGILAAGRMPGIRNVLQIRSAPDYEIAGRPNSPPPELLTPKIGQAMRERNATMGRRCSPKGPVAKREIFGNIPSLRLRLPIALGSGPVSQAFRRRDFFLIPNLGLCRF